MVHGKDEHRDVSYSYGRPGCAVPQERGGAAATEQPCRERTDKFRQVYAGNECGHTLVRTTPLRRATTSSLSADAELHELYGDDYSYERLAGEVVV